MKPTRMELQTIYKRYCKDNPCRLRNTLGSENGTCECQGSKDCPLKPAISPAGLRAIAMMDQMHVSQPET